MRTLACPATWVYADSREPGDILEALKAGRGFVTLGHKGPTIDAHVGEAGLGEAARGRRVRAEFGALSAGDVVRVITDLGEENIAAPCAMAAFAVERELPGARFVRFEVWKTEPPSMACMPRLISNPIYFE